MDKKIVAVLGEPNDPHVGAVCREITDLGHEWVVLDAWSPWEPLTLELADGGVGLKQGSMRLQIGSIWLRLKPRLGSGFSEAETFALRERREFLMALSALSSRGVARINDPCAQERARNKPLQLMVAARLGMCTPRTWVGTDAGALAIAAERCGTGLVYKPLTWLASLDGRVLFTNSIGAGELERHRKAIAQAPGIFQELVEKSCEYRVTMVDDELFVVRLHSQERLDTSLDWRRNQEDLRYARATLPDALCARLRSLMRRLRLRYAAIDLIETREGRYVFLEANPAGNWLWLEERVGIGVSGAIARALCAGL